MYLSYSYFLIKKKTFRGREKIGSFLVSSRFHSSKMTRLQLVMPIELSSSPKTNPFWTFPRLPQKTPNFDHEQ